MVVVQAAKEVSVGHSAEFLRYRVHKLHSNMVLINKLPIINLSTPSATAYLRAKC